MMNLFKKFSDLVKHQIQHKLHHLTLSSFKKIMIKGGLSLLIITVMWEIIEDVIFPCLFWLLGRFIHPIFYTGIPISWAICLHWLVVPFVWGLWMKYKSKN
jgi:hypothetical protein